MKINDNQGILHGLWVSPEGVVHSAYYHKGQCHISQEALKFFAWTSESAPGSKKLKGGAPLKHLIFFNTLEEGQTFLKNKESGVFHESIRILEHQYLLQNNLRLFDGLHFSDVRRAQCDIETACSVPGGFSNPKRAKDRVLSIGFRSRCVSHCLVLNEFSNQGERALLERFNALLLQEDPDTIEGHNIFKFDLDYLRIRAKKLGVPCAWGRFGQEAHFRNSRIRIAERWVDFPRCDIPGRTVVDTYLLVQLYDLTRRDMPSYGLKDVALYFGVSNAKTRTYIDGGEIETLFNEDRDTFLAYLKDDLRETEGIASLLLPTYFAQTASFPMTFQEILLRGTASKIDLLFLDKYFHARESLPIPEGIAPFEGGYTKSFEKGVYKNVLHFDVTSLYPSLLLNIGRVPKNDTLGVFIPILKELRSYRLKYKQLARETDDANLKAEHDARQAAFKIIINSFYGYLGFGGGRFSDGDLAAEVTSQGRALIQKLIELFQEAGCVVLEADTDGLYIASDSYFNKPEALLGKISHSLPEGIELECDGLYPSMFCYKSKNYALYDGERVIIRGSGLRSRGMEPYLKELTDCLLYYMLGISDKTPRMLADDFHKRLQNGTMEIEKLSKSEFLSQNPNAYAKAVELDGKPRRASLEVALRMIPMPRMGDRVSYFITPGEKPRDPDWKRACPVNAYNPKTLPYDALYYAKKIDAWVKRYQAFFEDVDGAQSQQLLF